MINVLDQGTRRLFMLQPTRPPKMDWARDIQLKFIDYKREE